MASTLIAGSPAIAPDAGAGAPRRAVAGSSTRSPPSCCAEPASPPGCACSTPAAATATSRSWRPRSWAQHGWVTGRRPPPRGGGAGPGPRGDRAAGERALPAARPRDRRLPGTYDVVVARLLLGRLDDPVRALARLARRVRPGGLLVIHELEVGPRLPDVFAAAGLPAPQVRVGVVEGPARSSSAPGRGFRASRRAARSRVARPSPTTGSPWASSRWAGSSSASRAKPARRPALTPSGSSPISESGDEARLGAGRHPHQPVGQRQRALGREPDRRLVRADRVELHGHRAAGQRVAEGEALHRLAVGELVQPSPVAHREPRPRPATAMPVAAASRTTGRVALPPASASSRPRARSDEHDARGDAYDARRDAPRRPCQCTTPGAIPHEARPGRSAAVPRLPRAVVVAQAHRARAVAGRARVGLGGEEHAVAHVAAAGDRPQRAGAVEPAVDAAAAMAAEQARLGAGVRPAVGVRAACSGRPSSARVVEDDPERGAPSARDRGDAVAQPDRGGGRGCRAPGAGASGRAGRRRARAVRRGPGSGRAGAARAARARRRRSRRRARRAPSRPGRGSRRRRRGPGAARSSRRARSAGSAASAAPARPPRSAPAAPRASREAVAPRRAAPPSGWPPAPGARRARRAGPTTASGSGWSKYR